ncbi:hypothetical protein ACFX2H_013431 [Malus domestica]
MSSLITAKIKSKADELYHGDEICQQKAKQLLSEISLPNGLLPLKQNKSYTHKFEKIDKLVDYAPEGIAIVEKGKIKKLTGVKTNELLVWVRLSDIYVQREVLFNSRSDSTQPAVPLLRNSPRFDQLKSKSTITGTISPNKVLFLCQGPIPHGSESVSRSYSCGSTSSRSFGTGITSSS